MSFVLGAEIQLHQRPVSECPLFLVQRFSSIVSQRCSSISSQSLHVLCSWCRDPAPSATGHLTARPLLCFWCRDPNLSAASQWKDFALGAEIQLHHRPVTTRPLFLVQRPSCITDQSLHVLCFWCRDPALWAASQWKDFALGAEIQLHHRPVSYTHLTLPTIDDV